MTQPEYHNLSATALDNLFPFNILIDKRTSGITHVGPALERVAGIVRVDTPLEQLFRVIRPRNIPLDVKTVSESNKLYVLEHKINGLILRGQFCYVAHHIVCFACSVQISSSNTMEQHKLCVNDFSPADPTPDILILHRFREIQLKDQQKQISKLESLIEARDTFDRHAHTDDLTGIANRRRFWSNGREIVKNLNNE
nr:hypothetical protein [Granulosicoccus sp.]